MTALSFAHDAAWQRFRAAGYTTIPSYAELDREVARYQAHGGLPDGPRPALTRPVAGRRLGMASILALTALASMDVSPARPAFDGLPEPPLPPPPRPQRYTASDVQIRVGGQVFRQEPHPMGSCGERGSPRKSGSVLESRQKAKAARKARRKSRRS